MASKFGRAGGVPERRVRPIWDAIDSRQFKSALKQVSSLLTKYPNSPYVLSLKALILERMAKPEEALSVCLNAKELLHSNDSALMDDLTLSTLQIVFQRLDHSDLATSCYEYACGKFPNNIDLMMGLFNCYVRESAFVKQQQIAIKMYKIASEERFLLWAVCSIQLQVLCGNGGEKLLRLAEGLLKKHIAAHSLHEPEALMVYISLLEQQDKYSDALELLSGNLGSLLIVEVDKLRIQGRLLARTGDYKAAADVYEKILESCPDDWECLQRYLGCLLEDKQSLAKEPIEVGIRAIELSKLSPLADEEFDSRILRATTFLRKLQENLGNDIIRCPYLANLEIERRKLLHGKGDQEKLIEDLLQYFHRFGHLACFTSDVEVFVQVISLDRRMEFFEKLMKSGEAILPMPPKVLGQSITLLKVQQLLGNMFSLTVGELEDFVVKLVEMYCKNLPLSKDLDPQESMHGEELLSMACNILTQLFWRTGNLGYMVEAVIVLEFGLSIRRHVWQYKILLLHLYSHLGATSLAYDWYKTLEVKNILMETVSHNILPQMLVSPLWVDLNTLLTDYLKFMEDHFKESADLTFLAYRHRNYSKVIEFVQFKERLQNSSQYLLARIESVILQLKQSAGNIEEEELVLENLKSGLHCVELSDEIQSKALTFNEDLESRPWWTPIPGINYLLGPFEEIPKIPRESLLKQSEANIRALIERKALLPRMIYLSIRGASASLKDSVEANGSLSDPNAISEMKLLLDRYAKIGGCLPSVALRMIGEVCKGSKSTEVFGPDEIDWVNFAVFFNACKLNSNENDFCLQDGQVCEFGSWQDVDKLLERCILTRLRSIGSGASVHGNDFEMLVRLITEPLAWHGLLIQSYVRTLVPSGKKKKKSGFMDRSALTLATAARDSIESLAGTIEEVMRCLRDHIRRLENKDENLEGVLASLRHKGGPGQVCQILETIVSSASSNEQGDRISAALKSWNPVNLSRKIVSAQRTVLSDTLSICESKCKVLNTLKQQILQI